MRYQSNVSKAEGDRIALAVLELVRRVANQATAEPVYVLDRNIRPEPPEAKLGYMPSQVNG